MKRLRRALLVALVVAAAALGLWRWRESARGPELKFETARVERGKLVARVTATGTLSALVTVQVGAQVSGRVQKLFADFNSRVTAGQVIARIDPALFEASLEQARANRAAAEGNLARARAQALDAQRQAGRSRTLRSEKLVAQADADTADANAAAATAAVAAALGQLAQSKAALHQATINLNYTSIVSPIDGVVISRNVDVGQTVASALQAPTLFTIAQDLGLMQVDTSVAESDVGKLVAGGPATFTVDAYPSERFHGTIRQIRNAPTTVQNVVTYDAVIDVRNPDLKLKPGMTANVTFVHAEKDGVLRLPNAALRFRPPAELTAEASARSSAPDGGSGRASSDSGARGGVAWAARGGPQRGRGGATDESSGSGFSRGRPPPDRRTVWVLRGAAERAAPRPIPVQVKIGITDGTSTEIVEGELAEGDLVVTDTSGGAPTTPPGGPPQMPRRIF